ncbi:MAG: PEP-CTERM sorting domain-containing protein [Verrucomicrobia bacterium]|nr:PEP-CTERM sorting domain-containing protein [Verrucomicrobiota bacterium]
MNLKLTLKTTILLAGSVSLASAAVLSTDFSGSTGNISLPYVDASDATNNGNHGVTRNQFTWTQSEPAKLALRSLDSLTIGNYTWGSASTPISAGRIFTSLGGGAWNTGTGGGGTTASIRATGTTDPTRARIQFNAGTVGGTASAPADVAVWNLIFEVGATGVPGFDFSFRAGTAQTNGAWDNNTAANNGSYNIRITPVNVTGSTGVAQTGSSVTLSASPIAIGAGAGPTLEPSWVQAFPAGVYLLQLEFTGQGSQRNSIGDFSMTAIPEPSTYAALFGLLALGFVAWRRRRKA